MKLFSHIVVNVHNTHSSIHNSEKKEFVESMVYPLETMRRELKDIMKRAKEVSYISRDLHLTKL